jgi:hypothetical protein
VLAAGSARATTLPPPLPPGFAGALGSYGGDLILVRGATAAVVRRLWDVLDGARITASPADWERPKTVLWWPRDDPLEETLHGFAGRLAPQGKIWVAGSEEALLARVLAAAEGLGFKPVAGLNPAPYDPILCLMR